MERLEQLLRDEPGVQELEINLKNQDIQAIWQVLGQFRNLKRVRLSGNEVSELPIDLSLLSLVESLTISLSPDLRSNLELGLQGLTSLGNLAYLHIPNLELAELSLAQQMFPTVEVSSEEVDWDDEKLFTPEQIKEVTAEFGKICEYGDLQWSNKAGYQKPSFKSHMKKTIQKMRNDRGLYNIEPGMQVSNLKARRLLYHICIQELESITSFINQELSSLWKNAVHHLDLLFEESLNISQVRSPRSHPDSFQEGKRRAMLQETEAEWVVEKAEMQALIQDLERENKRYLDRIIQHSKASATHALKSSAPVSPLNNKSNGYLNTHQSESNVTRVLSLKQLKDLISEIYLAKIKHNEQCQIQRLPETTMAEFLNHYFNKKFGLKSLRSEWVLSVWTAVDRFSGQDNNVTVFGKILSNECEEEFPAVQKEVKKIVEELVKLQLKSKFPFKNEGEIEELLREKVRGELAEIIAIAEQRILTPRSVQKQRRMTREELSFHSELEHNLRHQVSYQDFLKVLLDFQYQVHAQFLEMFIKKFKEVDGC